MLQTGNDIVNFVLRTRFPIPEAVADATNRLDARRWELRGQELGAQPGHVDVDRPGLDKPIPAPDEVEQFVAAEDSTRRPHEHRQQLELLARELHRLALNHHLEPLPVDLKLTRGQASLLGTRLRLSAASDHGSDSCDQLAG